MKNYQNIMNKLKMLSIQYVISVVFQTGIKKNTRNYKNLGSCFHINMAF